jgi:predicted transcriptional regulator
MEVDVIAGILLYSTYMPSKTITFRLPEDKLQALDSVAEAQQRDRNFVINEAVTQYLSLHDYHRELIEEGVRQDMPGLWSSIKRSGALAPIGRASRRPNSECGSCGPIRLPNSGV